MTVSLNVVPRVIAACRQNIDPLQESGTGSALPKLEIAEHGADLSVLLTIYHIQIEFHIAYFYDTAKDEQCNTGNDCKDGNIGGDTGKDRPEFHPTIGGNNILPQDLQACIKVSVVKLHIQFRSAGAYGTQQGCDQSGNDCDAPFALQDIACNRSKIRCVLHT